MHTLSTIRTTLHGAKNGGIPVGLSGQFRQPLVTQRSGVATISTVLLLVGSLALSIIVRVPAWHSTRLRRINKSPRVHALDPGPAAELLNLDAASLGMEHKLVGQLFETFVATELTAHLVTAEKRTEMYHLRQKDGKDVDIVLERQGRVVGLEVKSATKVTSDDAAGLKWLRDKLGDGFHYGAVLYSGEFPYRIDDRIWALPISSLWERTSRPD